MKCCLHPVVFRTAMAVTCLIGCQVVSPQSRADDSRVLLSAELRHGSLRNQFSELLQDTQSGDWQSGWQLADEIGVSVASLLLDLWASEGSQLHRRLLFLGAYGLAAGPTGDEEIGSALGRLGDQEKVLALLMLASGPRRAHDMESLTRLTERDQKMVVRVAAYAAMSRFWTEAPPIRTREDREDAGLVGAALFAGLRMPERELETWFRAGREAPGDLVWRGYLLAEVNPDPDKDRRLVRAEEVYEQATASNPEDRDARRAAVLCLARLGDPGVVLSRIGRPDPELLLLLATVPEMRSALPDSWLLPVPTALVDPARRRRLAVLYVLKEPVDTVLAAAETWTRDRETRGPTCLALAWRMLGGEATELSIPGSITELPEGAWVQLAAGETPTVEDDTPGDPVVVHALRLALKGRLPAAAARQVLEEALWRSGSHPTLGHLESEAALLRDLLLSGSNQVSAKLGVDPRERYLPAGIPRSDHAFFDIAYRYLQFVAIPRKIPSALRLR